MANLTYFPVRGLGEQIRVILEYVGAPFTETRVPYENWEAVKPTMPFGQVPFFKDETVQIPQSQAIVRYLAHKHNLYGSSIAESAEIDVILEGIIDFINNFFKTLFSAEFKAGDKKPLNDIVEKTLTQFEGLKKNKDSPYYVGNKVSVADLCLFNAVNIFMRPLAKDIVANHPVILAHHDHIAALPRIAAYLSSDRRPAVILPARLGVLCTPEECK